MRAHGSVFPPLAAPAAFAFLSDVRNETRWRASIVDTGYLSDAPAALGTEGFTRAEMKGRSVQMPWRITALIPGTCVEWTLTGGPWRGGGSCTVRSAPGGSEVDARLEVRFAGVLRAVEPLMAPAFRRGLRTDLARLAAVVADLSPDRDNNDG